MKKNFWILFLAMAAYLTGCHTTNKKLPEENSRVESKQGFDLEQASASMWSPTLRSANASYYFLVSEYESLRNNHNAAKSYVEAAYNMDPNDFLARKMIQNMSRTGQLEEALLQAKKMVLLYPKSASIRTQYGQFLLVKGLTADAEKELETAIDLDPKAAEAYLTLIEMYSFQRNYPRAIVIARELTKKIPDNQQGWSALASLYLISNQKRKALKPASRAYEMNARDPERILIYALALEFNDQSDEAVKLYEKIFRLNSQNEELIRRMVGLYRQLGDVSNAITLLDEVLSGSKEERPGILLQKAFLLWETERFAEASRILYDLVEKHPDSDRLNYLAGIAKAREGDLVTALVFLLNVVPESAFWQHARFRTAVIHKDQKNFDQAIEIIKDMIARAPENITEFVGLGGAIYSDQGKHIEAADFLKDGEVAVRSADIAERDKKRADILFLAGVYEEKAGDLKRCAETMKTVISINPHHSSALNYLGYLYAEQGIHLDQALTYIEQALQIKPDDGYYTDSLAWVYYKKGDYRKALALLEKADKLAPGEGVILEHLGDVYIKLGDPEKAAAFFRQALEDEKLDEPTKSKIKSKLSKIESGDG